MTINKSQGQMLNQVSIYLLQPVFSHNQLYVTLSRVTLYQSIKLLINNTNPLFQTKNELSDIKSYI